MSKAVKKAPGQVNRIVRSRVLALLSELDRRPTRKALAKAADLQPAAITDFLKGRTGIGLDRLDGMARELRVPLVELFEGRDLLRQRYGGKEHGHTDGVSNVAAPVQSEQYPTDLFKNRPTGIEPTNTRALFQAIAALVDQGLGLEDDGTRTGRPSTGGRHVQHPRPAARRKNTR